jgi:hypothetical protein
MNQQQQTGIDPLLLGGITKATHLRNIKNKAPTPTFKKWLDRQYEYIGEARTADDEKAGSAIRKNKRKSKNAQGNECGFVVRLLGSGNKALGIQSETRQFLYFHRQLSSRQETVLKL